MRFFPVLFILLMTVFSGSVSAQVNDDAGKSPSTDEYKNVPPGILMSEEAPAPLTDAETASAEEDVMTMDDLVAAYNKGQFDLVAKHVIPIANSNYPQAEEMLGIMYLNGQGVPKDSQNALTWLTKAADAGLPLAQHHLAIINFSGEGVQQDSVKALMWLYIAIVHYPNGPAKDRAIHDRDNVMAQLGRRDKARAFDLAHDWLEKRNEDALLEQPK